MTNTNKSIHPNSLNNLKPDNRKVGKQRIAVTLKPETIIKLRKRYGTVSNGIELLMKYDDDYPKHKIEQLYKDYDGLSKEVIELRARLRDRLLDKLAEQGQE